MESWQVSEARRSTPSHRLRAAAEQDEEEEPQDAAREREDGIQEPRIWSRSHVGHHAGDVPDQDDSPGNLHQLKGTRLDHGVSIASDKDTFKKTVRNARPRNRRSPRRETGKGSTRRP